MNKITKTNFIVPLLSSVVLMATISACNGAKTASDAPNSTDNNGQIPASENVQTTQDDAESETRRNQLNADIQAREQRNDIGGNPEIRAEGDLASEVRSKLEANIPGSKLTVAAENADVTVSGVVETQEQLDKIQPLAMEIKGVQSVIVKAVVNP